LTHFLKILVFPLLFLWETIGGIWGPDCTSPVSAADWDGRKDFLNDQPFMLLLLLASVFGALHFMTWTFSMATMTELWMWRSASIALTSLPILSALCHLAIFSLGRYSDFIPLLTGMLLVAFLILHPLIRFVISVDSVVLLRSLPDSAFLVLSWSEVMPSL